MKNDSVTISHPTHIAPRPIRREARPMSIGFLVLVLMIMPMVRIGQARTENKIGGPEDNKSVSAQTPSNQNPRLKIEAEIDALKSKLTALADQLIRAYPDDIESRVIQGIVYRRLGNNSRAVEIWEKVLQKNPNHPYILNNLGAIALEKEDFEQAIEHWEKLLTVDPQTPEIHQSLARALQGMGKYRRAIDQANLELKHSVKSPMTWYVLGQCHLQLKEYEKAQTYYKEVLKLAPDDTHALYGLFTVCARLKQTEQSKVYLARFKELKARNSNVAQDEFSAANDLAALSKGAVAIILKAELIYLNNKNYPRAQELLQWALELDPDNTVCLKRLSAIYEMTGKYAQAFDMCSKVLAREPANPENHLALGMLALRLKQWDRAEQAFEQVIVLAPGESLAYRELARVYLLKEKHDAAALQLALKAVSLETNANNYHVLAWAYARNGQNQSALNTIEKAVSLAPKNAQLQRMYQQLKNEVK